MFLQAAALVGVEQARILHTQLLRQKAVLIVGDAQLLTHAAQHLKAAGDVHVAIGQIVAHHALERPTSRPSLPIWQRKRSARLSRLYRAGLR